MKVSSLNTLEFFAGELFEKSSPTPLQKLPEILFWGMRFDHFLRKLTSPQLGPNSQLRGVWFSRVEQTPALPKLETTKDLAYVRMGRVGSWGPMRRRNRLGVIEQHARYAQ